MNVIDDLIATGRALVDASLSPGSSGNISARAGNIIHISASGSSLGALDRADFAHVTLTGEHVAGPKPSKEVPLHLAFYERDTSHRAVVHVHSPNAVAFSCCEPWADHNAVPPLTPYFVMKVGQTPLLPYRNPGDPLLGEDLKKAPWPIWAALLANHGSVTAGSTAAEALGRAVELEEACRIALITNGTTRRELPPDVIHELSTRWASPWSTAPEAS